tara:strand:+ start:492 stop:2096 length:1605 start_codon:yes stop_codon:yes gene_type:complete
MKKRHVVFEEDLAQKLKKGVDTLANAVKTTMGPKGKLVLIQREHNHPTITKDGVTVARSIELSDELENMAVKVLKEAASRTSDDAGDGTTTSTVLAQAIFNEGLRMKSAGYQVDLLKSGIEKAVKIVIKDLSKNCKKVEDDSELKQVALISANGEEEITNLIVDAIKATGVDGSVIVEEARGFDSSLTIVDGYRLERGFLSPYFVSNKEKMNCEFNNPLILMADRSLNSIRDLMPILEMSLESSKPIVIIANDIDGEAMQGLVLNKTKGSLRVCAIKSPGFGASRHDLMLDLHAVVGGTIVDSTSDFSKFTMDDFGTAKKIIVGRSSTMIIANSKDNDQIHNRIVSIKERQQEPSVEFNERELLTYRLQQLSGGIAILRVGAATESELIERYDRVDDALHATRAALEEGILPGGGIALVRSQKVLLEHIKKEENDDIKSGMMIVARSIVEPFKQIIRNGKNSPDSLLKEVQNKKSNIGYDARTEKFGNMFKIGILDPYKVVRCALENAASAAIMLLSVGCCLIDVENETSLQDN